MLPRRRDDDFGLEDEYGVMIDTVAPDSVWSKVVALCSKIRLAAATRA